ncbi:hypothetical protein N7539_002010 [Penicillium diatomitis]|uniref:GDS1 winged helix domain-containing protein n=1 Tax=Penicillium diatomitis TaxID=2819901 RepID=A0A9W9XJ17_9EURO|nr:uncharacterized protein N7539_002010 [Penicillium diatomitis]KAJ5493264.1 hypothetical protein N7539_002010 [Penicillium diatomitis]
MPYNTRRKSLSLPSLGIQLPNSSRRSPSISKLAATDDVPPAKKVKRSHPSLSPEPSTDRKESLGRAGRRAIEHTPPPSPMDGSVAPKIDTDGINDDIVVGVIEQLEKTGNRPHLVKELAAVLVTMNTTVANSANPAALLSSRLAAYMKRPWTALSPCPMAKELIPIHPRKVYYYLTTYPRQTIPDSSDDLLLGGDGKTITPSVSSMDQDEEEMAARQRSPSPEVDLSSPDFEDHPHTDLNDPAGRRAASDQYPDPSSHTRLVHSNRAASPPLEGDEKEFTQTASAVRERASEEKASQSARGHSVLSERLSSGDEEMSMSSLPDNGDSLPSSNNRMSEQEFSDYFSHMNSSANLDDEVAAAALFGTSPSPSLTSVASGLPDVDMKMSDLAESHQKLTLGPRSLNGTHNSDSTFDSWRELRNPETVEFDELDEMFGEI